MLRTTARRTGSVPATVLSTAALLALALLAPVSAEAVGDACHGQAATLVGTPQIGGLVGTDGPDVVVSNGSRIVESLGGDDVTCVTGSASVIVFAGEGDDLVDGSAVPEVGVQVELGAGSDRFIGGAGSDSVWGGRTDPEGTGVHADTEADVIETGPPPSRVEGRDSVWSGQEGQPNADVIRMGLGNLEWGGVDMTRAALRRSQARTKAPLQL